MLMQDSHLVPELVPIGRDVLRSSKRHWLVPVTIGGKKFWVFNYKFIASFIFVHEVIAYPVCAYRIMSIRIGGI